MDECRLQRDRGNAQEVSRRFFFSLLFHDEITMEKIVRLRPPLPLSFFQEKKKEGLL